MALIKNQIPILEYDSSQTAVFAPGGEHTNLFPEYAVFPFLADEIDRFARRYGCRQIGQYISATKVFPIYEHLYNGKKVCLCQAPVGAAPAVQLLDYLIGNGCKKIISAGSCGALLPFEENEFFIPTEALRCEGASYHYLPPSRTVRANQIAVAAIEKAMRKNKVPYQMCKTWTTDGFYRETKAMVEYRKAEGCSVVEMECAALMACAEFRNAVFGQILFTADTLADADAYQERGWGMQSFPLALKLCLDAQEEL